MVFRALAVLIALTFILDCAHAADTPRLTLQSQNPMISDQVITSAPAPENNIILIHDGELKIGLASFSSGAAVDMSYKLEGKGCSGIIVYTEYPKRNEIRIVANPGVSGNVTVSLTQEKDGVTSIWSHTFKAVFQ